MSEPLKELYNSKYIQTLSDTISSYFHSFDTKNFTQTIFNNNWQNLELKQRMRHISTTLGQYLTQDYIKDIDILKLVYKDMQDPKLYLENMIFQDFVEVYGLNQAYIDISLDALKTFTIESSSEFAIRRFIIKYPTKTITKMKKWSKDPNEHIRRLASEGCRPRLPWAIALEKYKNDPSEILPILETLQDDKSKYVQKSVANSLNDISKDNPNITINIVKQWINQNEQKNRLLKHACRTLLKSGNQEVLKLFGYGQRDDITVSNFKIDKSIKIGETLEFGFELKSSKILENTRVEYAIYYLKKNNNYSKKNFQIASKSYKCKYKKFKKSHSFKKISTRKYYIGKQYISIIVNGEEKLKVDFELLL